MSNLKAISSRPENTILYSADDVPIWHHFNDEILINFKLFYWLKTILGDVDFINKNYEPTLIEPALVQMAKDISFYYNQTNSVEIWTEDSFNSTIKQVEYFWESGFFQDKKDAFVTIRKMLGDNQISDFADVFRLLYDEVDDYGKGNVADCILTIAKYQLSDAQVVDKEINVMAMMIELLGIIK